MEGLYALKSRGNQLLSTRALLQLNEPELVEPEETLAERMRSRGDISTFATRLGAARKISDVFPLDTYPADHVHIYVALPDHHSEWSLPTHSACLLIDHATDHPLLLATSSQQFPPQV